MRSAAPVRLLQPLEGACGFHPASTGWNPTAQPG